MAHTYDIQLGGARTVNPDTRQFPSGRYNPLALIKAADHKNPISYAITRVINPAPSAPTPANGSPGDPALRNFIDFQSFNANIPIVTGDLLTLVALPNGSLFDGFYWEVETPAAGFTFSIGFARIGNGAYTAGDKVIPDGTIGTILLNAQSGAAAASGFRDAAGAALVADTAHACQSIWIGGSISPTVPVPPGDALVMRIDALPTSGVGAANWGNLRMKVSPIVRELVRGQW